MIKVKALRNGFYQGHYYFMGRETVLPKEAIEAIGEDHFEILGEVEEPKQEKSIDEAKQEKSIDEAKQDKQIKQAVVKK